MVPAPGACVRRAVGRRATRRPGPHRHPGLVVRAALRHDGRARRSVGSASQAPGRHEPGRAEEPTGSLAPVRCRPGLRRARRATPSASWPACSWSRSPGDALLRQHTPTPGRHGTPPAGAADDRPSATAARQKPGLRAAPCCSIDNGLRTRRAREWDAACARLSDRELPAAAQPGLRPRASRDRRINTLSDRTRRGSTDGSASPGCPTASHVLAQAREIGPDPASRLRASSAKKSRFAADARPSASRLGRRPHAG